MKVVWVCNGPTKKYCDKHDLSGRGASWIESIYDYIVKQEDIDLTIIFLNNQKEKDIYEEIGNVDYYAIKKIKKYKANKKEIVDLYKEILSRINPDVIHVWGTEFPQILYSVDAAKQLEMQQNVVINLQGMCAAIAEHYYAGIPEKTVRSYTLRDFIKRDNLYRQKKDFTERSKCEAEAIGNAKYVIGRTDYDRAYSTIINPKVNYLTCNETIRPGFYRYNWEYSKCKKYSIFLSQAYYPLKGMHFVLKAVAMIKDQYPQIEVNVAGSDIVRISDKMGKLKSNSYARYLRKMIKKYDLGERINFIGNKTEEEMIQWYLRSNVFISASSTENESNSLGEAKVLGMPVIASFVGGVSDRISHKVDGLAYQYDDPIILARYISDIFDNTKLAIQYGIEAQKNEKKISNQTKNNERLIEIYKKIEGNS